MGLANVVVVAAMALTTPPVVTTGPATPSKPAPRTVTEPDWAERPSGEDLGRAYPALLSRLEIEGWAVISCDVADTGRLIGCKTVSEAPANMGFGPAAVSMAWRFKMKPQAIDGQPVAGGVVRIPISFRLPQSAPEKTSPPLAPASDVAMIQARRMVDARKLFDFTLQADSFAKDTFANNLTPADTRAAGVKALQDAWTAHRDEVRDTAARAIASVLTVQQMSVIADYWSLPVDEQSGTKAVGPVLAKVRADYVRAAAAAAHDLFCADHPCGSPAEAAAVWRPDRRPGVLDSPQWGQSPMSLQLIALMPPSAAVLGVKGAVRMSCALIKDGALDACVVEDQAPSGMGFGASALKAASSYRLSPLQMTPELVGKQVIVRLGFVPPAAFSEPFEAPAARSAHALELVQQLPGNVKLQTNISRDAELATLAYIKPADGVDKAMDAAQTAAIRAGFAEAQKRFLQQISNTWAALVSEAQLARMVAFETSDPGKALAAKGPALAKATADALLDVNTRITAEARKAFCAQRSCVAPPLSVPPEPSGMKPESPTAKP